MCSCKSSKHKRQHIFRFAKNFYKVEEAERTLRVIAYRGLDRNGNRRVGPDNDTVSENAILSYVS